MRENYTKETAETDEKMSYISSLDTLLAYTVGVTDTSSSSVTRSHCVVVLERPRLIACPQGVAIITVGPIHAKNQFIHCVNGVGSKTAKIIKNVILPTVTSPDVNVMLSNITFLMIFAVFDPTPLTQ